jgi:hypothetical protein
LHSTKTFDIIFSVMRDTTRQHLCDELAELAGVRGALQSLTAVTWHDADYHEATWSEETQWLDE